MKHIIALPISIAIGLSLVACLPNSNTPQQKTIKFSKEENALYDEHRKKAIIATNNGKNRFVDYDLYPAHKINLTAKDFDNEKVKEFSQKIRQLRFHGCIRDCVALMEAEYARILKLSETEKRCYGTAWHGLTQYNYNANLFNQVYYSFQRHVTGADPANTTYKVWAYDLGKDLTFVRNSFSMPDNPTGSIGAVMSEPERDASGGIRYRLRFFVNFDKHNCPTLKHVDEPVLWAIETNPHDLNPITEDMKRF